MSIGCKRAKTILNHGGKPPYPLYLDIEMEQCGKKARIVGKERGSMHFLASRLPAAYAETTGLPLQQSGTGRSRAIVNMGLSPIPPYYYNGVVWEESACGGHMMGEHLLSDRLNVNIVCGADRLRCPAIRVRPPQERACAFWQNDYRRRVRN